MTNWQERKLKGLTQARNVLEARTDLSELVSLTAKWSAAISALERLDAADQHPLTVEFVELCTHSGLPDLAEAVLLFGQREGAIPPGRWLLAYLLGLAEAQISAVGFSEGRYIEADFLSMDSYGAWEVFVDALTSRLMIDQEAQKGFWQQIDSIVDRCTVDPGCGTLSLDKEYVGRNVRAYQEKPDFKEVWETALDAHVYLDGLFLLGIARQIAPNEYLKSLARFPHPVFVNQCVDEQSFEDLPGLIKAAPLAFDNEGILLPQGMVLFALLRASATACRNLGWGDSISSVVVSAEIQSELETKRIVLQSFIDNVVEAVISREDAATVGLLWLERLVFEGEHRGWWHLNLRNCDGYVLNVLMLLIVGLSSKLEMPNDLYKWIDEAAPLWRVDRMAAILIVAAHRVPQEGSELSKFAFELLVTTAPIHAGASNSLDRPACVIGQIGANAILAAEKPADFTLKLWDGLRPLRERAWRSGGQTTNNAGEIAVLWAICAMEAAEGKLKRELWEAVAKVLESGRQTDHPSSDNRFWSTALRRFARSTSQILTQTLATDTDIIAELLRPHIRADSAFFEIIFAIEGGGVNPSLVRTAVSRWGMTLKDLASLYLKTHRLRISRLNLYRAWLDRITAISEGG
ncbi:MAG: hypothetical protein ACJLUP_20245 [Agrobacterium tumefaciens]